MTKVKSRLFTVTLIGVALMCVTAEAQSFVPSDAATTCTVDKDDFAAWFAGGAPSENGIVLPANSLNFSATGNCDFFKWSWQMFLWLTSPTSDTSYVFNSEGFYDMNLDGTLVDDGQISVRDQKEDETAQAGPPTGVLMPFTGGGRIAAKNALVHYGVHVNDVFAYFAKGFKAGAYQVNPVDKFPNEFPTSQDDLTQILGYAQGQGATINDGMALAMELKTSWVEVAGDASSNYITVKAQIPQFTMSSETEWTWDGQTMKDATLALVGFHIAGSTAGHPELIWATFEQLDNAPNNDYSYKNGNGKVVNSTSFKPDGTPLKSDWQFFSQDGNEKSVNVEHMKLDGTNVEAVTGQTISASDTLRYYAWGTDNDVDTNTQIASINNSVMGQLVGNDVRKNYALIGAVWTNGEIPTTKNNTVPFFGSTKLSNSTLETYTQHDEDPDNVKANCLSCHATRTPGEDLSGLSHIWDKIQGALITYKKQDFGFNDCDVKWGPLLQKVTEADMIELANEAKAKGFTYQPSLRYGQLMIGDYPADCKSPANLSWPLYLAE